MFDLSLYLKAIGIGVAIAAPVGPMSLLCMRRTLTRGWGHGLAIGSGIAIGDAAYGAVAALHIAAGLFLIYQGLKTFWASRADVDVEVGPSKGWPRDMATSILLTLTNPPMIIMFAAVFTALAPASGLDVSGALSTVADVFTGSLLWWCLLVALVSGFRHAIGRRARAWINRTAGAVLRQLRCGRTPAGHVNSNNHGRLFSYAR